MYHLQIGADATSNGDGAVMDLLWAEERGNAHAETMRLRERGKRMARFIHYFTRFVRPSIHSSTVQYSTSISRTFHPTSQVSSAWRERQDGNENEAGDSGSHHLRFESLCARAWRVASGARSVKFERYSSFYFNLLILFFSFLIIK